MSERMRILIPLSVPNLGGNEKKYVEDALNQGWVSTGGKYIELFETKIAAYVKEEKAVACQSGTAGLHLSLLAAGVKKEDIVLVPTLTFIAAVNPVSYLGAIPIFLDCDESLTLDANKLQQFCEEECNFTGEKLYYKKSDKRVKAIVVVHIFGNMADMEKIMEIADKYHLSVIEDATEALGTYYTAGKYRGKYAGTIGDFGVYSFNGNKIITTGGGGMIVAKDKKRLAQIKYLSTQAKDDALYYIHNQIGFNYRMTNLQAALGVAQLEQIEKFIETKKENYLLYKRLLEGNNQVRLLDFKNEIRPNYWFYSLAIKNKVISVQETIEKLKRLNIQARPVWSLIHMQVPYKDMEQYRIEKAVHYQKSIVNVPCSSNLLEKEIYYVVDCLKKILD